VVAILSLFLLEKYYSMLQK